MSPPLLIQFIMLLPVLSQLSSSLRGVYTCTNFLFSLKGFSKFGFLKLRYNLILVSEVCTLQIMLNDTFCVLMTYKGMQLKKKKVV